MFFSVVMATHGRDEHIRPSIASVLRQSFGDFELIVVGDGEEATPGLIASFGSPKLRWLGTARQSGSQAAPNNAGIAAARGEWVAYLGHDDIWSGVHLQCLKQATELVADCDAVVAGCLYHGPPGTGILGVTGLLEHETDILTHFVPPSSVAHRRGVAERIGGWRDPRTITAPDDADFMLRAAHGGCRFAATGRVSVHKFAAGHRYLSYVRQSSGEQAAMLADPRLDDPGSWWPELSDARRDGLCMHMRHPDFSAFAPGALFARNRANKGIARRVLTPLGRAPVVIEQTDEPRALDWYAPDTIARHRWSGPNPRPKILIPFTHRGRARVTLAIVDGRTAPDAVAVSDAAGRRLPTTIERTRTGANIVVTAMLHPARDTILTLHTPAMARTDLGVRPDDHRRLGVALADITVEPLRSFTGTALSWYDSWSRTASR